MAEKKKNTPVLITETKQNHETEALFNLAKADILLALSTLDAHYKERIRTFADMLHALTQEIEDTKSDLAALDETKAPHEQARLAVEKELDYELRLLERLTEEWNQKSMVIAALELELSELEHSEETRQSILKHRKEALDELEREIEALELSLLEHALEKENVLLKMEPIEHEIRILKQKIKKLKSKKRYIEASQLHNISPSTANTNLTLKQKV